MNRTLLDSIIAEVESNSSTSTGSVNNARSARHDEWLVAQGLSVGEIREYAQERAIVAVTEAVERAIEQAGISRTEIAKRLGASKGHITQVLSGTRNMTLRTLGDLLWAAGFELHDLELAPLEHVDEKPTTATDWLTDAAQNNSKVEATVLGIDKRLELAA